MQNDDPLCKTQSRTGHFRASRRACGIIYLRSSLAADMILNSWKEIASYLRCSVRTAQRMECDGMPVRRPAGHVRSAVVALSEEIDQWLKAPKTVPAAFSSDPAQAPHHKQPRISAQLAILRKQMAECRERSNELRLRTVAIRESQRSSTPPTVL